MLQTSLSLASGCFQDTNWEIHGSEDVDFEVLINDMIRGPYRLAMRYKSVLAVLRHKDGSHEVAMGIARKQIVIRISITVPLHLREAQAYMALRSLEAHLVKAAS